MDSFYPLHQIQQPHRAWVGDKAFHLAGLLQQGCPVVPGVVISAQVFQSFLETIQWLEPLFADLPNSSLHVDVDNPRQLQAIARQIQTAIQATPLEAEWFDSLQMLVQEWQCSTLILRPSPGLEQNAHRLMERDLRGVLQTQLCDGASQEAIATSLKRLWSELFRAKSLLYWQRTGIQLQEIRLAVLVQPLYPVLASGTLNFKGDRLEVRATYGLGLSILEGKVTPDYYAIHAKTRQILEQRSGQKSCFYQIDPVNQVLPLLFPESKSIVPIESFHPMPDATYPGLKLYPVPSEQQRQYTLTPDQLAQLIDLAQQLSNDIEPVLEVEWLIAQPLPGAVATPQILQLVYTKNQSLSLWKRTEPTPETVQPSSTAIPPEEQSNSSFQGIAAFGGRVFAKAWVLKGDMTVDQEIPPGVIVVASRLAPSQIPALKQIAGIITTQGGTTSHGAIVAREMGIPAVVGVAHATDRIQTGDILLLDGDRGMVIPFNPSHLVSAQEFIPAAATHPTKPTFPQPTLPTATRLWVNLSTPDQAVAIAAQPVDGIGLLRSELMLRQILTEAKPEEWVQNPDRFIQAIAQPIQQLALAFAPRPVLYRSLDLRSHEHSLTSARNAEPELNPSLGLHGTLSYQVDPTLFDLELAALRQVQQWGQTNLRLILPFVRTVEEFEFCYQRIQRVGLTQDDQFQVWIMAEVPSVLFLLPDYVKAGVQGISIGSNDLTQLLLGLDRDQPNLTHAFNQQHPAVLRAIKHLIQTARAEGIPCSICGQAPALYPELVESLVRWGIHSISVSPDAVESTYWAIARAEHQLLLEGIRQALHG